MRLYASILRDGVRLWTASPMTGSIQSALERWESPLPKPQDFVAAREQADVAQDDDEAFARHQASKFLVSVLSPALVPYHPRFEMATPWVTWQLGVPDRASTRRWCCSSTTTSPKDRPTVTAQLRPSLRTPA